MPSQQSPFRRIPLRRSGTSTAILCVVAAVLYVSTGARDSVTWAGTFPIGVRSDGSLALNDPPAPMVGTVSYQGAIRRHGPGFALVELHTHSITVSYSDRPANAPPDSEWRYEVARQADTLGMGGLYVVQPRSQGLGPAGSAILRGARYSRVLWSGVLALVGIVLLLGSCVHFIRRLILNARTANRIERGCCWRCGYDLTGSRDGPCPECGTQSNPVATS